MDFTFNALLTAINILLFTYILGKLIIGMIHICIEFKAPISNNWKHVDNRIDRIHTNVRTCLQVIFGDVKRLH